MTKVILVDNGITFDSILLRERPFGGAEVAFVSLVEHLAKIKMEVVVYNNCKNKGLINGVNWKKLDDFSLEKEQCDVFIVNRGDKYLSYKKDCKNRIFWIHNPANYLLKFRYLFKLFFGDFKIIFSSKYHMNTFPFWAPAKEKIIIPYGIDKNLFKKITVRSKIPNKAIFTSNPMRGLNWLLNMWKKNIYKNTKSSYLEIFAGSKTYGAFGQKHKNEINTVIKKAKTLKNFNITVKRPVKRNILFKKIEQSRIFLYQGSYDETFCMAVAEAQMLGIPSVVMNYGCMSERVINNKTGFVCENELEFCERTISLLNDDKLWLKMHKEALKRKNYFSWDKIIEKWKEILT